MAVDGEPLYAMVSNLEQTDNGYVSLGGAGSTVVMQRFTTGPGSYRLQGIGVNIEGSDDSDGNPQVPGGPSSVSVAVHTTDSGLVRDKLFDLVSPDEFQPGHSFFEAPPGTLLEPDTEYALVWSYAGGTWHRLQKTLSDDQDSGGLSGFLIENHFLLGSHIDIPDPDSAGNSLEIAVYGYSQGEPPDGMVSNLEQDDNGYVSLGGAGSTVVMQRFTTGPGSYRLQGIGVNIEGSDDTDGNPQVPDGPSSVSVAVHTTYLGLVRDKLFDLVSPDEFQPGHSFFERRREPCWSRTPATLWCGPTPGARGTDCPGYRGRLLPGDQELAPHTGRRRSGGPVQAGLRHTGPNGRHVRGHRGLQRLSPGGSSTGIQPPDHSGGRAGVQGGGLHRYGRRANEHRD